MKNTKAITCAVLFVFLTVAFVHVNAQCFAGWGAWNDLNWCGLASNQLVPGVSMGAFAGMQPQSFPWLLFNAVVLCAGWRCEWVVLAWWYRRKR